MSCRSWCSSNIQNMIGKNIWNRASKFQIPSKEFHNLRWWNLKKMIGKNPTIKDWTWTKELHKSRMMELYKPRMTDKTFKKPPASTTKLLSPLVLIYRTTKARGRGEDTGYPLYFLCQQKIHHSIRMRKYPRIISESMKAITPR